MRPSRPRLRTLAPIGLLALAAAAGCADEDGSRPAATVNGLEISSQEVVDELEAIRGNERYLAIQEDFNSTTGGVLGEDEGTFNRAFVATQLSVRIQYAIIEDEVEARGIDVDDACIAAAETDFVQRFTGTTSEGEAVDGQEVLDAFPARYRAQLLAREAALIALQGGLAGYPCTGLDDDELLEAYFEEHRDEFAVERCVSVIQAATRAEADEVTALLAGGASFDDLLVDRSAVPGDTESQCIPEENLLQSIPEVLTLEPGQVAAPAELPTQAGTIFFIARLDEVRQPTFETSREQIATLIGQEINDTFQEWYDAAVLEAQVTVDPRYGTWNPATRQIDRPAEDGTTTTDAPAPDAAG